MAKIDGGYILKARKTLQSELMDKPPLYSKLWDWMLMRAEWRGGQKLKRGQFHTTIEEMREAMSWSVGYRKVTPTIKEIRSAYEWFSRKSDEGHNEGQAKGTMIGTTKGTRGMVITILNYNYYQDPKNYEGHSEGHNESPTKGTTKGELGAHDSKEVEEGNNELSSTLSGTCRQSAGDHGEGDEILKPQKQGVPTNGTRPCPHQEIIKLYHEVLPELPVVRVWNDDRQANLRARWREDKKRQTLDWWRGYFEYVRRCPWLMGFVEPKDPSERTFIADLEWLVRRKNMPKVLEGKYEVR